MACVGWTLSQVNDWLEPRGTILAATLAGVALLSTAISAALATKFYDARDC